MAAPYNNIRSKTNRAIAAYLVSLNSADVGDEDSILPENTREEKKFPYTVVRAVRLIPDPRLSGNYRAQVYVEIRGSAVQAVGDESQAARLAFDRRVASTVDALMQSDDGTTLRLTATLINTAGRALAVSDPTNNADMVDFSVTLWLDDGAGEGDPEEVGCDWREIIMFQAIACGNNVD